jgi:acyl-CoA synthetase (AMP-forming)/AMP-acid ligase II
MVSHDNLVAGATIVSEYLELTAADRVLAALPWSFDYGLNQVLAAFASGSTVVVQRSTLPGDICRTLATTAVTGFAGVPLMWTSLTSGPAPLLHQRLPALRYITNTGGTVPAATIRRLRTAQPAVAIYLMYGLTEAFRSTYLHPAEVDARPTSIGRAIGNTEILVVADDGTPSPPGKEGELVHRGPTVALGYWRDAEATREVFRPHPWPIDPASPETVVYSGDHVTRDQDGYLYYIGRRDKVFKSRGVRVNPHQIEVELMGSGMLTAAIVLPPNPDGQLVAVVVPGDASMTTDELQRYCRAELATYMQPDRFIVMDTLPTTPTGKPDRIRIRSAVGLEPAEET